MVKFVEGKTGWDRFKPVFRRSSQIRDSDGPETGPRLRSWPVHHFSGLDRLQSGPVSVFFQSWDWTFKHYMELLSVFDFDFELRRRVDWSRWQLVWATIVNFCYSLAHLLLPSVTVLSTISPAHASPFPSFCTSCRHPGAQYIDNPGHPLCFPCLIAQLPPPIWKWKGLFSSGVSFILPYMFYRNNFFFLSYFVSRYFSLCQHRYSPRWIINSPLHHCDHSLPILSKYCRRESRVAM
jgi:hypothetical protein